MLWKIVNIFLNLFSVLKLDRSCKNLYISLHSTDTLSFIADELQDDSTLHLLKQKHQALAAATEENINFTPHYDTLIQSGTYEYWASRGQNPLRKFLNNQSRMHERDIICIYLLPATSSCIFPAYSLAELIDNALSATAKNQGVRKIEIRMVGSEFENP